MTSLKVDQKFQAPPRENFWLRHCRGVSTLCNPWEREKSNFKGGKDASGSLRRVACILTTMTKRSSTFEVKIKCTSAAKILDTPI